MTPTNLTIDHDAAGHDYIRVGNTRLTYLPASFWADGPSLRIQAYRDGSS